MRILILGAYGMLGHKLWRILGRKHETYATCRASRRGLDLAFCLDSARLIPNVTAEYFDSVIESIDSVCPDVVINCIGIVKQRPQAKETIPSILVNALFPHRLASLCKRTNTRLIHFSTDCVFSGKKGMYVETDIPDAEDLYGRTKHLGEINEKGCVTIRSSIIGRELTGRMGFLEWVLSNKGGAVSGFTNAIYSGFTTTEMARIVNLVIKDYPELSGVWHVASKPISKFDLLNKINSKLNAGIIIRPDGNFCCDRSLNAEAFNKKTGYIPPSWDVMIEGLSEEWNR